MVLSLKFINPIEWLVIPDEYLGVVEKKMEINCEMNFELCPAAYLFKGET